GDFYATTLPLSKRSGAMSKVARVVLVHRLREVTAQVGFTRFEAAVADVDGELALDVRRASLSREATWVPAIENRREGVLVALDPGAVERCKRGEHSYPPHRRRLFVLAVSETSPRRAISRS